MGPLGSSSNHELRQDLATEVPHAFKESISREDLTGAEGKATGAKRAFPILVVEDNPVTRRLLEKTLKKSGYEVVSVGNGRRAMELLSRKFFPVVLTDWIMPEIDGLELCRSIRRSATDSYVFIILLTAKDSKDDIITGLEAGADDYLTKPFNQAELMARLKTGFRILALEKSLKEANQEIKTLSITDPLTRCYNRTYMNERLPVEIKRARRYSRPLSMAMCDLDHFKRVNDTYGHQIGDLVLRSVGQIIGKSIRNDLDWAVRYGGEEFLVVFPETDLAGARKVAERLKSLVSKTKIRARNRDFSVTASFGVTGFDSTTPEAKTSLDEVVNRADELLYQAKKEGRDRIKTQAL